MALLLCALCFQLLGIALLCALRLGRLRMRLLLLLLLLCLAPLPVLLVTIR